MPSKEQLLASEKIPKLFVKLVIPSVIAQLITLAYNMVDRMYIGHIPEIGGLALTGVGVCMPVTIILSAFAQLIGGGGAPRVSILLGQQQKNDAELTMGSCGTLLALISVPLTILTLVFAQSILTLFGASGNTLPYAMDYLAIYALGTIFVEIATGLVFFITAQGFTLISMLSVLAGAVLNIILDPIFIFTLDMGVRGAALATVISQAFSAGWVLFFLFGKRPVLRLRRDTLRFNIRLLLPCLSLGLSPFVQVFTECFLSICFNRSLLGYGGDIAVGAMTIFATVMQIATLPMTGFAQGAQSITSYNYGAGRMDRVTTNFKLLFTVSLCYAGIIWLLILCVPELFIWMFADDSSLIAYSTKVIRIYFAMLWVMGPQYACQMSFVALGNAKTSLFLAILRKIILLIPLIYLVPLFVTNQVHGVFLAEPIADTMAAATTTILFFRFFRKKIKIK